MEGYLGKLLRVNLTTGKAQEALDANLARGDTGGAGLGLYPDYYEIQPGTDLLGQMPSCS